MKIVLSIRRFQPEGVGAGDGAGGGAIREDSGLGFQAFEVDAEPASRLLDALIFVQRRVDPTLSFRRSCGHGVCGSDAMLINGREGLACKTLVRDVADKDGAVVTIEPLRSLDAVRDLVVDEGEFFKRYRAVKPYLIEGRDAKGGAPATATAGTANGTAGGMTEERERRQSPAEREVIDDATNCILCAACYSACPVVRDINRKFIGPAAVVQAFRFIGDSRDHGFEERHGVLNDPNGVWPCENKFECTRVCPRGIKVTKLINATKRRLSGAHADVMGRK